MQSPAPGQENVLAKPCWELTGQGTAWGEESEESQGEAEELQLVQPGTEMAPEQPLSSLPVPMRRLPQRRSQALRPGAPWVKEQEFT